VPCPNPEASKLIFSVVCEVNHPDAGETPSHRGPEPTATLAVNGVAIALLLVRVRACDPVNAPGRAPKDSDVGDAEMSAGEMGATGGSNTMVTEKAWVAV
jgi:hypothetical protein